MPSRFHQYTKLKVPEREYRKAIGFLFLWQNSNTGDNLAALIYRMMQKSDYEYLAKWAKGFPAELKAFAQWYTSQDQNEFFKQFGLELYNQSSNTKALDMIENDETFMDHLTNL